MNLSQCVLALRKSRVVSLWVGEEWQTYVNEKHIESLAGATLNVNEDV